MINRRNLIIGAVVALIVIVGAVAWWQFARPAGQGDDTRNLSERERALLEATQGLPVHALGDEAAPVRVIEYASPTCPHCATFHNAVYPEFRAQYVDTGKVQFILRPFVRNVLDSVVFMVAEAAGPENYHNVIETYFRTQGQWFSSSTPRDAILEIAKQLGFTEQSFDDALENQDVFNAMEAMREQALDQFGLEGTPTFYINGSQLTGDQTLAQLSEVIDPLVPADFVPTATPDAAPAAADAPAETPAEAPATPAPN